MKNKLGIALCLALAVSITGCSKNLEQEVKGSAVLEDNIDTEIDTSVIKNESDTRIICWGDSLTFGTGGNGTTYPSVLEEKTGLPVYNYGVEGEKADQIAIRMGVYTMTVAAFTIPENTSAVPITLSLNGEYPVMFRMEDYGFNPCTINGIQGKITYKEDGTQYYFSRISPGEETVVEDGTQVVSFASEDKNSNDIIVLFAGSNDRPSAAEAKKLVDTEKAMLEYLGCEKYIVVGLTSKEMVPDVALVNKTLSEEFGDHFLDIRTYLLEQGLKDADIKPTNQDNIDVSNGEIPSSLRVDIVHGTPEFYKILGEQIYEKMIQNGYL